MADLPDYPQYPAERYWYEFDFLPILEDNQDQVLLAGSEVIVPAELTLLDTRAGTTSIFALIAVAGGADGDSYTVICNAVTIGGQTPSLALSVTRALPSYNNIGQLPLEGYWHHFNYSIPLSATGDIIVPTGTAVTVPASLDKIATYVDGAGVWCHIAGLETTPFDTPIVVKCHARTMFGQRMELYEAVVVIDPATLGA